MNWTACPVGLRYTGWRYNPGTCPIRRRPSRPGRRLHPIRPPAHPATRCCATAAAPRCSGCTRSGAARPAATRRIAAGGDPSSV